MGYPEHIVNYTMGFVEPVVDYALSVSESVVSYTLGYKSHGNDVLFLENSK